MVNIGMSGKRWPASIKHRESVIHSTSIYRGSPSPMPLGKRNYLGIAPGTMDIVMN